MYFVVDEVYAENYNKAWQTLEREYSNAVQRDPVQATSDQPLAARSQQRAAETGSQSAAENVAASEIGSQPAEETGAPRQAATSASPAPQPSPTPHNATTTTPNTQHIINKQQHNTTQNKAAKRQRIVGRASEEGGEPEARQKIVPKVGGASGKGDKDQQLIEAEKSARLLSRAQAEKAEDRKQNAGTETETQAEERTGETECKHRKQRHNQKQKLK